jgi:hypothetical protein
VATAKILAVKAGTLTQPVDLVLVDCSLTWSEYYVLSMC